MYHRQHGIGPPTYLELCVFVEQLSVAVGRLNTLQQRDDDSDAYYHTDRLVSAAQHAAVRARRLSRAIAS